MSKVPASLGASAIALLAAAACGSSNGGGVATDGGGGQNGGNVTFAPACTSPAACGGVLDGTWDVAESCVEVPTACATATGTLTGNLTISTASSSFSLNFSRKLTTCTGSDGAGDGDSGPLKVTATTIDL